MSHTPPSRFPPGWGFLYLSGSMILVFLDVERQSPAMHIQIE